LHLTKASALSRNSLSSFNLSSYDEEGKDYINLILTEIDPINGTGNSLDNILTGNEANNILDGLGGNDTLYGRGGNDTLYGRGGSDSMFGGTGDDTYYVDDPGDRVIERKDAGTDTVNTSISYALSDNVEKLILLEGTNAINGTGNDESNTITGNSAGNVLDGKAGSDTLFGGAGNDTLFGGAGSDSLYGDGGNDALYGDADDDFLVGGAGNDLIDGGDGFDTVSYETTVVAFEPPYGVNVNIDENRGYQTPGSYIYSDPLSTIVIGFNPTLSAPIAAGTALDRLGNRDTLRNLERIIGSSLDDVLIGNNKDNTIQGLAGNDIFIGNAGDDTLDGGDGIDTVSYRLDSGAVIVNLAQNSAVDGFGGTDKLLNIENVLGSDKDDYITGNIQVNWLFGGNGKDIIESGGGNDVVYGEGGNDSLFGEKGNDKLIGGSGADLLNGGDGFDIASYTDAIAGVIANLSNPQTNTGDAQGDTYLSIEYLEGSQFADVLVGNGKNNYIWGLGGDDYLDGLGGNAILEGGVGNDTYRIDNLGTQIIEYLNQGTADTVNASIDYTLGAYSYLENLNLLEGTAARNGTGNELGNIITGNSANNILNGADGDDRLIGERGADILTGGNGRDIFAYTNITDAGDMIMDFTVGSDKIEIKDILKKYGYSGSQPLNDGYLSVRQVNAGLTSLQIDLDGFGNAFRPVPFVLLKNVQANSLDINSFTSFTV